MLFGLPLLSLIIWLPIAAGIAVLATGGDRNAQLARWIALIGSVAGFLVAIPLYTQFDPLTNAMQFGNTVPGSNDSTFIITWVWMESPCP